MSILTKKVCYIVFGFAVMILLSAAVFLYYLHSQAKRDRRAVPEQTLRIISAVGKNFQNGDIICREGSGIWSTLVVEYSPRDKRYSHAGILFFTGNQWQVIHSEADGFLKKDGVFIEPVASFIGNCKAFAVYRLKDKNIAAQLPRYAQKYLNTPFDFSFNLEDKRQIYCTELIYWVMQDAGLELATYVHPKMKQRIVPVDSCYDPKMFDEVVSVCTK